MSSQVLHALPGCLFIAAVIYVAVASWPRARKGDEPASKDQKLRAANRWRW